MGKRAWAVADSSAPALLAPSPAASPPLYQAAPGTLQWSHLFLHV